MVAQKQFGLATWGQMRHRGIAKASISRAIASGFLTEVHPGVYSTIAPSLMQLNAWHAAAILAGGPEAVLCAESAAWWANLTKQRPREIHVAVKGKPTPIHGIRWHRLKLTADERAKHNGMPITALHRIPLDLAASSPINELKRVLAELEFHYEIEPGEIATRRGFRGSARLRRAIAEHTPQLAETRSHLEQTFVHFLTSRGLALPTFNHPIGLSTVDAVYHDQRLAIELDGVRGHGTERRILRDHRRDLHRRADGYTPLRYHYAQLHAAEDLLLIEGELERYGVPRGPARPSPLRALTSLRGGG